MSEETPRDVRQVQRVQDRQVTAAARYYARRGFNVGVESDHRHQPHAAMSPRRPHAVGALSSVEAPAIARLAARVEAEQHQQQPATTATRPPPTTRCGVAW
jgi:hypothetical protein